MHRVPAAVQFCAKLKAAGLNILRAAADRATRMAQAAQAAEPTLPAPGEAAISPIFVLLGSILSIFRGPLGKNPKRIVFSGHMAADTAYALPAAM